MSLLAPLYFLGVLAVGLPILFHLIRRRPRDRQHFSSLMFLSPTPPRLTKRSRLENWPLLLIRALIILLIAAAFTRPFLRESAERQREEPEQLVMVLVDSSASMRREGLWTQAAEELDGILSEMTARDRIGLISFDRESRVRVPLDGEDEGRESLHAEIVRQGFAEVEPSWFAGDLGAALTFAADALNAAVAEGLGGAAKKQLILISDMQAGTSLESLQGYAWPPDVGLDVRAVAVEDPTNVSAVVLQGDPAPTGEEAENAATRQRETPPVRVRMANAADSEKAQFTLRWTDAAEQPVGGAPIRATVPPGEVRIVRMALPPPAATALQLGGDTQTFDNTIYVATSEPRRRRLLYLGPRSADPRESLAYYLERASLDSPQQTVTFEAVAREDFPPTLDPREVAVLVLASPFSLAIAEPARQFMEEGGKVLAVLTGGTETDDVAFLRSLSGDAGLTVAEAEVSDYAMLAEIDFQSALFSLFADPRFSDFTKIRFWQHRRVKLGDAERWRVVAEFDNRDPAILQQTLGEGALWVLAAGWQPTQSQLALSTKFVPMLARWVDPAAGEQRQRRAWFVGDSLEMPRSEGGRWQRPDGSEALETERGEALLAEQPGIYSLLGESERRRLAVNLRPSESQTSTMEAAELERFGIVLGDPLDREAAEIQQRQLRNVELERQQSWWRWLVLAAVGLLAAETWWAARLVGASTKTEATQTPGREQGGESQ